MAAMFTKNRQIGLKWSTGKRRIQKLWTELGLPNPPSQLCQIRLTKIAVSARMGWSAE